MGIDFDLRIITPHPEYTSIAQAQADLPRIDRDLQNPRLDDDEFFKDWLEIERYSCVGYISRCNGNLVSTNGTQPYYCVMETIEKEDIDFLWKDRIPRGKITLFSGDPGIGKSTVASMIASTISQGRALPFDKELEAPLRSLIISTEDTPSDVLRPRLERMNADLSMIAIPNYKIFLTPAEVVQHIDELFSSFKPALAIFDPIIAYTSGRNTNKARDVREFLGPLGSMAERYKTAVILINHLTKSNAAIAALYRSVGSIDFMAVARSAFVLAKDKGDEERRFFSHVKSSLSQLQPTLEFFIEADGMFRWGIETGESADEVLNNDGHGSKPTQRQAAEIFLKEVLSNGPVPSNDIKDKAEKAGIAWGTIWRAKTDLGIKASKERETGAWFWRMP